MRAGRLDDANRLLRELDDRGSRGEYAPATASLFVYAGQGDLPAIRRGLSKALAEAAPPFMFSIACVLFPDACRSDPEIHRLLFELYGG